MTWYSGGTQLIVLVIFIAIIISIIWLAEKKIYTMSGIFITFFLIIVADFGLFKYATAVETKLKEEDECKYKIEVFKGEDCETYYTNEYKIKNGVVYFDGKCANNFSIETLE